MAGMVESLGGIIHGIDFSFGSFIHQYLLISLFELVLIPQKMKAFASLLLSLMILLYQSSSATENDSLLNKLSVTTGIERFDILIDLAYLQLEDNPITTIEFGEQAFIISERAGDLGLKMKALNTIGKGYQYSGNLDSALVITKQAYELSKEGGSSEAQAAILFNLGTINTDIGNYEEALKNHLSSLALEEQANNYRGITSSMMEIGSLYFYLDEPQEALQHYREALKYAKMTNEEVLVVQVYHNIGIAYQLLGRNDSALVYMTRYLENIKLKDQDVKLARVYNNIGNLHHDLNDFKEAERYYLLSVEISRKKENLKTLANTAKNLAVLYTDLEDYVRAEKYILEAIEYSRQTGVKQILQQSLHQKSIIYAASGRYKAAYETMEQQLKVKDSVFKDNLAAATAEMQIKYETEKKNQEIIKQDLVIARQESALRTQWIVSGGILALVIIAGLLFLVFFIRYRHRQKVKNAELKKRAIETEQRLLRSQMNPHFIFNALMSVQSYISKDNRSTAQVFLTKFSKLIRDILKNSRHKTIPLEDEMKVLNLYAELEQLRAETPFEYKILSSINSGTEIYIPPMMIQPFLENAIKHGIQNKRNGLIEVRFDMIDHVIRCRITDNGTGFLKAKAEKMMKHHSLALQIISERLQVLQQVYGQRLNLSIDELKNQKDKVAGTQVEITLPYEFD